MIWLSAVSKEIPIVENVRPGDSEGQIELQMEGLPEAYSVDLRRQPDIQVQLRGLSSRLDRVSAADIIAKVDLSNADFAQEVQDLPLRVSCRSRFHCWRNGVRLLEHSPDRIEVRIGKTISRSFEIDVLVDEEPGSGYNIRRTNVTPNRVVVHGAESAVDRIESVVVALQGVGNMTRSRTFGALPIKALDIHDQEVAVSIEPNVVESVDLRIQQQGTDAYIVADYTGVIADGYRVVGVEVDPTRVGLVGPRDLVQSLRSGLEASVDISGITADLVQSVLIDLPEGVEVVDAPESGAAVTVTIRVMPLQETRSVELDLRAVGLDERYEATILPQRVRVLLGGPQPVLDAIEEGGIDAFVDLAKLGVGTHNLRPQLELPDSTREISISPERVDVDIISKVDAGRFDLPGSEQDNATAAP